MELYVLVIMTTLIFASVITAFMVLFWLLNGKHNLNIIMKQEFSESDRQLLEDLYNKDGELKDKREDQMLDALDNAVRSINNLMLGVEEESDG